MYNFLVRNGLRKRRNVRGVTKTSFSHHWFKYCSQGIFTVLLSSRTSIWLEDFDVLDYYINALVYE